MIYTVTFNPAIDYVMQIGKLQSGKTNRSKSEDIYFGGKGINVSAVLKELHCDTTALGFIAGFTGDALDEALKKQGIKTDFIKLEKGYTRINVKLKSDDETEINAQGPEIEENAINLLLDKLDTLGEGDTLVLAGSIPSSINKNIYEKILKRLCGKGIRFVVDATGDLLENVLKFNPFLIKPNLQELEEIAGVTLSNKEEIISAARKLKAQGAQNVLVSLGPEGALLLDEHDAVHTCPALGGNPVNTVGAGDSMVAGFIAGAKNGDYAYALKVASATGGATATSKGLASKEKIEELLNE